MRIPIEKLEVIEASRREPEQEPRIKKRANRCRRPSPFFFPVKNFPARDCIRHRGRGFGEAVAAPNVCVALVRHALAAGELHIAAVPESTFTDTAVTSATRSCITLGQARQALVMAVHRQPSAFTRCSECDAGSATARTVEGWADGGMFEPARCFELTSRSLFPADGAPTRVRNGGRESLAAKDTHLTKGGVRCLGMASRPAQ
jgi:hypothetical protein